jgi:sulfur-carrier protein
MASIKIPTPLRNYTGGNATVTVNGGTIDEAIKHLVEQFPELEGHLFKDGELRNFVNVFLGDEDIRFLDGLDTKIEPDANLRIIPSIAGG